MDTGMHPGQAQGPEQGITRIFKYSPEWAGFLWLDGKSVKIVQLGVVSISRVSYRLKRCVIDKELAGCSCRTVIVMYHVRT